MKKTLYFLNQVFFWILSIFFFLFSMCFFCMNTPACGLVLLVTAILTNPKFLILLNKRNIYYKNWMMVLVSIVGILTCVMIYPTSISADLETDIDAESENVNLEGEIIDINNLDMYPFGESMKKVLDEIGVDDSTEAVCEVDNFSTLTIKLTTKTKQLWVCFGDLLDDIREIEWIKDYNDHSIYYYLPEKNHYYNEPIYSYKTNEIIKDKIDGLSEKYPLIVSVEQLVQEINADIQSASERYNGKWVQITGTVSYVSDGGDMYGYYLYGIRGAEGLKITCWIETENKKFSVGDKKTFLGKMREVSLLNNTEIADCKVVE